MGFKDISADITEVARHYKSQDLPPLVVKVQEILQQILQAIQEFWYNLFNLKSPGASNSTAFSNAIQYLMYVLGAAALIALIYVLWRRVAQKQQEVASTRRGAAAMEKILDAAGYRLEAEAFARANDFKSACRSLYLCLLQYMHEKSVVVFAPAKTNYEYKYLLAEFSELQSVFVRFADIVEHTWFGNRQAESVDYQQCIELLSTAEGNVNRIAAERESRKMEPEHD